MSDRELLEMAAKAAGIDLDAIKRAAKDCEEMAFEKWLSEACPSGDVTSVQNQWIVSAAYADLYVEQAQHPAVVMELVRRLEEAERDAAQLRATCSEVHKLLESAQMVTNELCEKVGMAYGYLWCVNNEPGTPFRYPPERAAYEARKLLRDTMTKEKRGDFINRVVQIVRGGVAMGEPK